MNLNPVILSIPIFFTLMGVELLYEAITRKKTYRLNDAITNINLGGLDQLTGTFFKVIKVGIYTLVYEHFAFMHLEANTLNFIILFVLYDLCYYWSHRMAHEISLFWGGHVVHHQSEDYNLSVALRQSSTSFLWSFPFYLPLALIGFDPLQMVLVAGFNLLYQFWIHTEHIDKLGWFEYLFNTPSHHRVHHGRDPKYIDKNYAGVFIIWDRIFGTFQVEEERPTYGITQPLNSWNPVYANFAHYIHLFKDIQQSKSLGDTFKMMFLKPGWRPAYLGGYQAPHAVSEDYHKYNADAFLVAMKTYIFFQFVISLGISAVYLFFGSTLPSGLQVMVVTWIIFTSIMLGLYFELNSVWLRIIEAIRLLILPMGIWIISGAGIALPGFLPLGGAILALISLSIFLYLSFRYSAKQREKTALPSGSR